MARQWSCKIRIHRPTRTITDGKKIHWPDYADVYGEDKNATVHSNFGDFIEIPIGNVSQRSLILTTKADLDIQPGYIVEVKKTRFVQGVVSVVSETVSPDPAEDATTLTVSSSVKFEPGDHCIITDATGSYAFRLKGASGTTLTLYDDQALPRAFTSATVAVREYFIVSGDHRTRPWHSQWQEAQIVQVPVEEIAA